MATVQKVAEENYVASRSAELLATDAQFESAQADPRISEALRQPGLCLAQMIACALEGYADRPALGQRAEQLVEDAVTGTQARVPLPKFETITYAELDHRIHALAAAWRHDPSRALKANDFICILGFGGVDFTTIDLAALFSGIVVVPLQTNASGSQLTDIVREVAPAWLAVSIENLELAIELIDTAHRPKALLVFDYRPGIRAHNERLATARVVLAAAGQADLIQTLHDLYEPGGAHPRLPPFADAGAERRLCTIYYTSGSTGSPKGAMYPESMVKPMWTAPAHAPLLSLNYMPMNHSFGRSGVFRTLAKGGTCYFAAKSDLSTLFEDIRLVRPTFMAMVPRFCEMILQQHQSLWHQRKSTQPLLSALDPQLLAETRNNLLGGRLLMCMFGSAPLAPELRAFLPACLGFGIDDHYGATEVSGVIHNTRVLRPPVIDYKLVDVPELGYYTTDRPFPRGELWIKTQSVMLGYFKRAEATAQVFDPSGYYKTGDIMAELEPDRLTYVDRRNNVLKLAQGEFVAVSRLESLFTNGHPLIRQVYIYGSSERSFLLAVVVPEVKLLEKSGLSPADPDAIKQSMREALKEVARAEQLNAYEIPRDFLIETTPFSTENGLLAGIGKYQRPKFKDRYGRQLEQLYEDIARGQAQELNALRAAAGTMSLLDTVRRAVGATLGLRAADLAHGGNFSELGGDSLSALSCAHLLADIFGVEVPVNIVSNPAGTLQKIADYVAAARENSLNRPTFAAVHGANPGVIRAQDLKLERFIDADTLAAAAALPPVATQLRTILLTGANGYLGRFLCLEWLQRMAEAGGKVICIVRGKDLADARARIVAAFDSGDAQLLARFERLAASHLEVLPGDLSEYRLGLGDLEWRRLASSVDLIVHPAALVNHVLPYRHLFGPNVVGTAELIRLSITTRLKPINNVSTMAVAMTGGAGRVLEAQDVREAMPSRPLDGGGYADGYASSKWAAEVLLREAHEHLGIPIAVFRSDMILAHTQYRGQINVPDMLSRWLLSIVLTGLAPRSFYEAASTRPHYDGLPVDFSALSMAALGAVALEGYRTYHVVNPHDDGISLDTFIDWAIAAGCRIQKLDDYAQWFERFGRALRGLPEAQRQRSSLPLLHQLEHPASRAGARIAADDFRAAVQRLRVGPAADIPHLSAALINKYLEDFRALGLLRS